MIIGTAGHIDHGKSALVEALTGRRMDRLVEERARGITIDLNFAPLSLEEGLAAGVVDVPGHEDFVRTMVAGAAGMDLVLLIIAADEGVMPQTREHLAIVELLGVARGIPVVTKCDLVEPDWAAMVVEEVDRWLASSPVAFCPAIGVSARRGDGLDDLRQALRREAHAVGPRDATAPFRMPIDRAFSLAGVGTVVTGSVWSGALGAGDAARVLPLDRAVRVRSIESHGEKRERALAGTRAALGLTGVERSALRRGDVVVDLRLPWEPSTALDARIRLREDAPRPLTARTRVHLHLGTAEVIARVLPLSPIAPGSEGLARLTCEAPIVVAGNDRFVIRSYSPVTTIGGGLVLDPLPPRKRAPWPPGLDADQPGDRLPALLARHAPGVTTELLALRTGLGVSDVESRLLVDPGVRRLGGGWLQASALAEVRAQALAAVATYHAAHPDLPGLPVETLRRRIHRSTLLAEGAVQELIDSGALLVKGGVAIAPGFEPRIPGGRAAQERVVLRLRASGLSAPPLAELVRQMGDVDVTGALRLAALEGSVVALTRDWYLARETLEEFRVLLSEASQNGTVEISTLREHTGLSRKHLIPLLEWSDREGITRRDGQLRRLT